MNEELIGPCGMNCGVCSSYLAGKYDLNSQGVQVRYCAGCRPRRNRPCAFSKRCELLKKGQVKYCYECDKFPCKNLEPINKRYSTHFHMSMIDNLNFIKENGMEKFLEKEEKKWKCPECGGVVSCHNGICFSCGVEKLKIIEKMHQWTKG